MKSTSNCDDTRELMPDLAAGLAEASPEIKAHLESCAECAGKLEAFRQTMSLLDEGGCNGCVSPRWPRRLRC
jgi:hypothetical protein